MKLLILLAIVVAANAKATPETCTVSEWSDWSRWELPNHDSSIESFPVHEPRHSDGSMRAQLRRRKLEQAEIFQKCMAEGTCPQYDNKQIDGFAPCTGGFAVTPTASYPCELVDHVAFIPSAELFPDPSVSPEFKEMNDVWGWVDPVDSEEYALVCMGDGVSFVRVTDAFNPVVVGHLKTAAGDTAGVWRDVKIYNDYAFIVSEHADHGMQVFDLSKLRGLDGNPPVRLTQDAHYAGTGQSHNIVESPRGFMYLVGSTDETYPNNCYGGLHAVDVSDPLNPTFAGCYGLDGYTHDAQCVVYHGPDTRYTDREICFACNEDTLTIVDVQDKSNMYNISRTTYFQAAYTHQAWLTEDHATMLLGDDADEFNTTILRPRTYVWDLTDLENPIMRTTFYGPLDSVDHDQYVYGDLSYQSNYRTGLRILRIDAAAYSLTEVAHFDVYPDADGITLNGAWSSYRFAPDKVVTTSIEYGVFILQPNVAAIEAKIEELKNTKPSYERRRTRQILYAEDFTSCPPLVEIETK